MSKKVTVREAQVNLTKLLKDLPFTIVRYKTPIAEVTKPITKKELQRIEKIVETGQAMGERRHPLMKPVSTFKLCKHGAMIGNCKHSECNKKG